MKKLFLVIAAVLFLCAAQSFYAQGKAVTPPKNSPVRKAIISVVKKKFGKTQKNIDDPNILKVQGNWARIVYDVESNGDEGSTGVNLLLKKTGGVWKIVFDYNEGDGEDPNDYFKGIPGEIYNPWE